jgi:hypothetical protein
MTHCGLPLKKTANRTKSSITMRITHFCVKSGQNELERFGTSKSYQT